MVWAGAPGRIVELGRGIAELDSQPSD